jgi:hypothetical protein
LTKADFSALAKNNRVQPVLPMPDEPEFSETLKKMDYEPLRSVEKIFISGSLLAGIALPGLSILISNKSFPG